MDEVLSSIVILGPTASGKTKLAVALAEQLHGGIISADSRQVYKRLDIGTGKDLDEYGAVPYRLIDVVEAGGKFDVAQYLKHTHEALTELKSKGLRPIICGGTGMYIQALIQGVDSTVVPENPSLREQLKEWTREELLEKLEESPKPENFRPDQSTQKRLIRALEICEWAARHPDYQPDPPLLPNAKVFGLNPDRGVRRQRISERLTQRLKAGLLDEVRGLLESGVTADQLIYYGLEYKYCTMYLTGELDRQTFETKLETEIHRFAKRQMTYFRKMEKDGIQIHWLTQQSIDMQLPAILEALKR